MTEKLHNCKQQAQLKKKTKENGTVGRGQL